MSPNPTSAFDINFSSDPAYVAAVASKDQAAYMHALDVLRMRKLAKQLPYCFDNAYYGAKMREAGLSHPAEIRTIDDFRALPPFLTKALHRASQQESLDRYGHPFGMHLCAPLTEVIHVAGTSGTTGLPTFYLFTRKDLELTYLTIGRIFKLAGIRPGDTILQLFGLSIWVAGTTMLQAAEAYGARPIPLGAEAGVTKALQYIQMCRPRVLFATPSMISHLIHRAPEQLGKPLSECGIEIILTGGEPGLAIPEYRQRIRSGTGATVFDITCGAWTNAASDCGGDEHHGLHQLSEDFCFRYDLVDPQTRKPVPLVDGAEGEAIHTGLEYQAAPALRYATGDVLKLRIGECPHCGRFGTRFNFLGRSDDMMNVAGVKVYPNAVKEVVETFAPEVSGHMQVVVSAPLPRVVPPVRLKVEASGLEDRGDWKTLADQIDARVHLALKIRTRTVIVPCGSLEDVQAEDEAGARRGAGIGAAMSGSQLMPNVNALVEHIHDGNTLVIPADYGGSPAEAARALVRLGRKGLTLMGGPPSGYVADLLIGAGCIGTLEVAGVILGDFGLAPRFRACVSSGEVAIRDTTCPAFHSSILAGQKGLPFMPMRGLIGSDILRHRPDWQVVSNPYATAKLPDPVVLLPALTPDVVLFHARYGDRDGNVWVGKAPEVIAMAQAAKTVLATFEHFFDGNLLDDTAMAPATLSCMYTTATAHVPQGAAPVALSNEYPFDADHMTRYAEMARTEEGFAEYLRQFVMPPGPATATGQS